MTVYIDITQLEKQRINTGIQRVVKEFINGLVLQKSPMSFKILIFNKELKKFQIVNESELKLFMADIKNYQFTSKKMIKIENIKPKTKTIFFDLDSSWNAPYSREKLYPILKNNGFIIYNFIHDLIPILFPQYVQSVVVKNFIPYISSILKYSDYVLFNSDSSLNDFLHYKKNLNIEREISTKTVGLGSDFFQPNKNIENKDFLDILSKKYILFVGTLEPRKNHQEVLAAFDILSKKFTDLNLVFIGIKGWNNEELISKLENHPLKNQKFYWLQGVDDNTLYHFYKNAFVVTYLSKYEGYGLPIVESLLHGNITITSNNSSMPEVGKDVADYIDDNSVEQLVEKISFYYEDKHLYEERKNNIKNDFKTKTWDEFITAIYQALDSPIRKSMKVTLKQKIKSIPILGFVLKSVYHFLKKIHFKSMSLKKENKADFLDQYYLAFENKFRGSRESILKRYEEYLKYIDKNTKKALDIGSGRGEWTQLLQQRNIDAHGVDMNKSMTAIAKKHGVKNLIVSDAMSYLKSSKSNTFDLITAFHIIEHIPYEELLDLLIEIKRVATPNATILLETPNPKNIQVAACNFYTDPTHLNPLPPSVIEFMVNYIGFKNIKIEFLNPVSLNQHIKEETQTAKKLNELIYQAQDYIVIINGR